MAGKSVSSTTQGHRSYRAATRLAIAGSDWPRVVKLLTQAVKLGSVEAEYALGDLYTRGVYIKKDEPKGAKYWMKASRHGHKTASYNLGVTFEVGVGVPVDKERAFRYHMLASMQGDDSAPFEIYRMLYHGIGVTRDRELAEAWRQLFERLEMFTDQAVVRNSASRRAGKRPRRVRGG